MSISRRVVIRFNLEGYDKTEIPKEISWILRELAKRIDAGESPKVIKDSSDEAVGVMKYERIGV